MKYVITMDNEAFEVVSKALNTYWVENGKHEFTIVNEKYVRKQADTIEELSDEFRGIWINYYESEKKDTHEEYHYDKEKNVFYDSFEELTHKEMLEKFDIVYAAIWTDKGLIYIARLEEKGWVLL